jgi:bis(5'-adenosyl)-triphosphatase
MTEYRFGSHVVTGQTFASNGSCFAIYNRSPIVEGHSLILPIRPAKSLLALSLGEQALFFDFSRTVTEFLLESYQCESFDWTIQDGEPAGQTVPHLHVHVLPRRAGDIDPRSHWYQRLMESGVDVSGRFRLPDETLFAISRRLRGNWEEWIARRF